MTEALVMRLPAPLPALVTRAGERAGVRFLKFFASNILNPNTRRAYAHAVGKFFAKCAQAGVSSMTEVQPLHVAAWIELHTRTLSAPTVKQHLVAIRHLFDWLVIGQVVPHNPAASVRGPSHTTRKGKMPVLDAIEARQLLDSVDVSTPIGLRDRALWVDGVFVRASGFGVRDAGRRCLRAAPATMVRLHEKGGKQHEMPCRHTLEVYLHAYLDRTDLRDEPKSPPFPTIARGTAQLSTRPLPQANVNAMVRRRALAASIAVATGNHTFRATGITAYLQNGGTPENAAAMAHVSPRTTVRYSDFPNNVKFDEVERVFI